jgi:myo-inositol catabolism protein IolC
MDPGYSRPLYLLPFDHRESYMRGLFNFHEPLTAPQHERVADTKLVIYEGFLDAVREGVPTDRAGILADEEFGAKVLEDAERRGTLFALSVEASGQELFQYAYGADFVAHIERFHPTFAKVLVRYNPEGDRDANRAQAERLKLLSDYCLDHSPYFMFELLIPATPSQLQSVGGDAARFDATLRGDLVLEAIAELQAAGVEPDVWKVEGLDTRAQYQALVAQARRDGRSQVGCIVLGRGADEARVERWLSTAFTVPGMIGFAVGRTCFWEPIVGFVSGTLTREAAAAQVSARFRRWVTLYQRLTSENAASQQVSDAGGRVQ